MADTYTIDPAHSSIQFSMMVSNVRGAFSGVKGTIVSRPQQSGSLQNRRRDRRRYDQHERREARRTSEESRLFRAGQVPDNQIRQQEGRKTGDNEYKATGDLTIHGLTKEVVLTVDEVSPEGRDPWGNTRIGASAKGKINRKDFGLLWSAPLETGGVLVGDDG